MADFDFEGEQADGEYQVEWKYSPGAHEELFAVVSDQANCYHCYVFECIGTVPADEDDEGDLLRVWLPDEVLGRHATTHVIDEINAKHGTYVESRSDAEEIEGFTPTYDT